MSTHGGISGGGCCWVRSRPIMLPCFSQGGCHCGAVAVEGSVSYVYVAGSDVVGALVLSTST
jgi:hypothetical protein